MLHPEVFAKMMLKVKVAASQTQRGDIAALAFTQGFVNQLPRITRVADDVILPKNLRSGQKAGDIIRQGTTGGGVETVRYAFWLIRQPIWLIDTTFPTVNASCLSLLLERYLRPAVLPCRSIVAVDVWEESGLDISSPIVHTALHAVQANFLLQVREEL